MRRPTQLRPFHARAPVDPEFPLAPLSSDPDYSSSSEQSCDTVIYIGPNGTALSDKELTDNEGPPDFVPIVPALQKTRGDNRPVEAAEAAASKSERDCLKCNTFAELQERLDCIDGSEEPNKFPFEELPIQLGPEQAGRCISLSQAAGPDTLSESDKEDNGSDNGQLTERDGTELPASKVQQTRSPAPTVTRSSSPSPASPRSIPGSSSQHSPSQLTQSPSLQSSRESLNSCGFVEGKPRPMGSPRLGIASLSKTSEYKPPSSPSQRCKVYTQKGVLPSSAPPPSLSKDSGMVSSESLLQPDVRTPPAGMSPRVVKKSMSAESEGFSGTPVEGEHQEGPPADSKKEILSTTMVTVQQPLELNGEDELVFTLVEELTISGVLDSGRPTSIISFNSDCSVQALASGSRPVSIISSISEDLECYSSVAPVSEVSITQFLPLPKLGLDEKARETGSRRSSISSWLSEMSAGSGGEQSCHSFIAQTCFGHGEAMAEPPASDFVSSIQNTAVVCREKPEVGTDNLLILSEMGEESVNKATPLKGCKISTMGKATVTISNSCEGYIPMKTNITVYPCIAMSPRNVQEPESSTATPKAAPKTSQSQESKEASARREMKFEDPWLKREEEVKKENSYSSEEGAKYEPVTSSLKTEGKSEQEQDGRPNSGNRLSSSSSSSADAAAFQVTDSIRRVVDGCEMALPGLVAQSPVHSNRNLKSSSLPRAFQKADRHEELDSFYHCLAESNGFSGASGTQSSKTTLERKVASPKHCVLARPKGTPPLPPVRKSSLDQKNRASPQHSGSGSSSSSPLNQPTTFSSCFPDEANSKTKDASSSSKLFSAKLEQLASRTNSLGRTTVSHYECLSLERAESLSSVSSRMHAGKDSTMPRTGRSLGRSTGASPPSCGITQSAGASPKASQSKISAVSKLLLASPKSRSLSTSTTKTLSFSTKSLPQSVGQSSNLPPSGKHMSWSTQSLSRNRGSGLASKLPLRAVNGRISELLQGSAGPRGAQLRAEAEERGGAPAEDKPAAAHLLPSPYSKITPPRKPHRCSSGHGSDNSSVLSGELPPAMGKTALFYHSGGSSGYESMMRDSEATGSASSAQDSMSENSSSVGGRCRSLKTPKKRSNSGGYQASTGRTEGTRFPGPLTQPVLSQSWGRSSSSPVLPFLSALPPATLAEDKSHRVYSKGLGVWGPSCGVFRQAAGSCFLCFPSPLPSHMHCLYSKAETATAQSLGRDRSDLLPF